MLQQIHTLRLLLDMKLMRQLSQLDRFDAAWSAIERKEAGTLNQLKHIATVESTGASTRIEGSKLSDDEVDSLIAKLQFAKLSERDEQEVAGYFETLETLTGNYEEMPLNENLILDLHKRLMRYGEKDAWHRGKYKKVSNAVEARLPDGSRQLIFRTAEPGLPTETAMQDLLAWYKKDKETIPLIKIALFVYEFLSIHPFQDGNGRLSRLLATLLLLRSGYIWIQYVSLEHEIESRKPEFYQVLMEAQRNRPGEDVSGWLQFFISCLVNIQEKLMRKLGAGRTGSMTSAKEKRILLHLQHHPGTHSGTLSEKLEIPLPTVKKLLRQLLEKGIISREGKGRGTIYFLD